MKFIELALIFYVTARTGCVIRFRRDGIHDWLRTYRLATVREGE